LSKFFTNPSIIIISPSHPTHYWSHPIGALIGKYDKTYLKYLTCCHIPTLIFIISFGTLLRPKETLEHMTKKKPTY
jgi:hypothetical protein